VFFVQNKGAGFDMAYADKRLHAASALTGSRIGQASDIRQ
jgi:hypothetical protein